MASSELRRQGKRAWILVLMFVPPMVYITNYPYSRIGLSDMTLTLVVFGFWWAAICGVWLGIQDQKKKGKRGVTGQQTGPARSKLEPIVAGSPTAQNIVDTIGHMSDLFEVATEIGWPRHAQANAAAESQIDLACSQQIAWIATWKSTSAAEVAILDDYVAHLRTVRRNLPMGGSRARWRNGNRAGPRVRD